MPTSYTTSWDLTQRLAAQPTAQPTKEHANVRPQLLRIPTAVRVCQRPEPVEPVRSAVPPQLRSVPPPRLLLRPHRIGTTTTRSPYRTRRDEAAAALRRLRIQRERPTRLHEHTSESASRLTRRPPGGWQLLLRALYPGSSRPWFSALCVLARALVSGGVPRS